MTAQNYAEFTEVYTKYNPRGLQVLGFPCNQFGSQEPGTNEEIQRFAASKGAKYPIFAKIDVNGSNTIPLYKYLKSEAGGFLGADIKWNFSKFLLDADGKVYKRYGPQESPLSFTSDIETLLNR